MSFVSTNKCNSEKLYKTINYASLKKLIFKTGPTKWHKGAVEQLNLNCAQKNKRPLTGCECVKINEFDFEIIYP